MNTIRRALTHTFFAAVALALIACGVGQDAQIESGLPTPTAYATPARSPVSVEIPPITDAVVTDAKYYAKDQGIDLDESVRRLSLQGAMGKLGAEVRKNESATYGGSWIQHEPTFGMVFAFTRDGEETIRPYVHGTILADMIEVRQVEATLAELKAAQRQAHETLKELSVQAASGIDVKRNIVEIYLPEEEKDKLDIGLQASGHNLPDRVEIVISPLPEALEATIKPTAAPVRRIVISVPTAEPTPTATATPTKVPVVSEATLPELSLEYKGATFQGYRFEGCWRADEQSDIQCVRTSPHDDIVDAYIEIERGDTVAIRITPDSRPSRLFAHILTEPGNISVSDLERLLTVEYEFVMDVTPGRYNIWIHAQWFEGKADIQHRVSYAFGLIIPGEAELRSECVSTAAGGILGIVLDSPEDRDRTALEAVNSGGCRFNKKITQVRLTLEREDTEPYIETFQIEPPSLSVGFPLREEFESKRMGGPLSPGEYSRKVAVVSVAGDEMDITHIFDDVSAIRLSDGAPASVPPIIILQHEEARQTLSTSRPDHIEGSLRLQNGCLYIRNGHIPVWPPDFSFNLEDGTVQILDENGNVTARQGSRAILKGREVRVDDPEGREIGRTLPLYCPPGNYWIIAD